MSQKTKNSSIGEFRGLVIASKGKQELKKLEDEFSLNYAFEGINLDGTNKVTLKDYKAIVEGGKVPKKYSEREVKEIINHFGAFKDLFSKLERKLEVTEDFIKDLHETLTDGILQGGVYRNVDIRITGAPKQPPHFEKIYDRMKHYIEKLNSSDFSVFEKAAYAHMGLHKIHPFFDANGRVSRLVMNYILVSNDYLPISVSKKNVKTYFAAIDEYRLNKKLDKFVNFIEDLLLKRYKEAHKVLK